MTLRLTCSCLVLLAAACTESEVVLRDAGVADAGDSGSDVDDSGAADAGGDIPVQDAAPKDAGRCYGVMCNNPPECPRSPPNDGTSCTGTTFCQWDGDCAGSGGGSPRSARFSARCVDGSWNYQSPDYCKPDARNIYDDAGT